MFGARSFKKIPIISSKTQYIILSGNVSHKIVQFLYDLDFIEEYPPHSKVNRGFHNLIRN